MMNAAMKMPDPRDAQRRADVRDTVIEARAKELERAAKECGNGAMARWLRARAEAVRRGLGE